MALSFRKTRILEIARNEGRVVVEDLSSRLGVAVQTIRRDLSELARDGQLDRVHGGALMPAGVLNIRHAERQVTNAIEKEAIARACAAHIPDNASVLLNIGTSTEAVARALLGHSNLTVLTNNLYVADILAANDSFRIIVAGGVLRASDRALVGDMAAEAIAQFKMDHAVIGVSAIDEDGDLMDFDLDEVRVSREIVRRSKRVLLVADRSKFERAAPVRIASLADIDMVFTDARPGALAARCADWGTELVEVAV